MHGQHPSRSSQKFYVLSLERLSMADLPRSIDEIDSVIPRSQASLIACH